MHVAIVHTVQKLACHLSEAGALHCKCPRAVAR